ncbi:hypothetical protein ES707_15766 [subsurface metagenome]
MNGDPEQNGEHQQPVDSEGRPVDRGIKIQKYYYLPCSVARLTTLTPGGKILYAVIKGLAGGNDLAGVSQGTLAKIAGTSEDRVWVWLWSSGYQGLIRIVPDRPCLRYCLPQVDERAGLIRIDGGIIRCKKFSQGEKLIRCYILWRQGSDGGCRQNYQEIAGELGLSYKWVYGTIKRLKAAGDIRPRGLNSDGWPVIECRGHRVPRSAPVAQYEGI